MAQKIKNRAKKSVKKSFFEINAPITSTKILLYGSSQEELEGETVKLDLTKSLRGKSLDLKLKVTLSKDKLVGEPKSIELANSYIKRIMRKGTDYSEDSFETESRDFLVKVKPLLITRRRVSRTVLRALRETAKKFLTTYIKTRTSGEIFSDIISNKIQKQLSTKLKKIYPLALCEIRAFKSVKLLEKKDKDSIIESII